MKKLMMIMAIAMAAASCTSTGTKETTITDSTVVTTDTCRVDSTTTPAVDTACSCCSE